jgi:hypothetical protein
MYNHPMQLRKRGQINKIRTQIIILSEMTGSHGGKNDDDFSETLKRLTDVSEVLTASIIRVTVRYIRRLQGLRIKTAKLLYSST